MEPDLSLGIVGSLFIIATIAIWTWQGRAQACARHQRWVGIIARILAIGCFAAGTLLVFQPINW
jgi:hypothetical protein